MRRIFVIAVLCVLCCVLCSCVRVTTERRVDVQSSTPGGERGKSSEIKVRTYGWDFFEAVVDVLAFPFKVVGKTLDLII
jgi:hypothetical protein